MKNIVLKITAAGLVFLFLVNSNQTVRAQTKSGTNVFGKIEMLVPNGERSREIAVLIRFNEDTVQIESANGGTVLKTFKYSDIKSAEYSYTKNPRWKTGLALGAASVIVFPLMLVAIPIGFSKHRRHWLSIRTGDDYAVLKLSKSVRKIFIPAFETNAGIDVEALGEDK